MKLVEIEDLVRRGESETLEFKKTTAELETGARTLCGFLNGLGGSVLFGVTSAGRIVGQDVADKTRQTIAAALRKFEPPASIQIEELQVASTQRAVIVLTASRSEDGTPYIYDGRPYERIAATTSLMPREKYQRLLLARAHAIRRWENTPAEGVSIADLDHEEILRTARIGIRAGRRPETADSHVRDILERLNLLANGNVLNAAVVLFGRRFLPNYPQCHLRLARFKGFDKAEFLDNRQVFGHGFQLLDEAMTFLQRHLPVAGRVEAGSLERIDEPLLPYAALREALVNALCHRDYGLVDGAINLAIYDDRVEIWSDGGLPSGMTVDDLKRDHRSRPRNLLIAEVFYKRGLVEQWGRGTQQIIELCVGAGRPEPEFIEQAGGVGVRFSPARDVVPFEVQRDLSDRQRTILRLFAFADSLALRDIRGSLEGAASDRTLQNDLEYLRRLGLIESTGHGRGARYRLKGR